MGLDKRKKKFTLKPGPLVSKDNIPYDYLVMIDAGSKGSRVYVYNWLNPKHALEAGLDLQNSPKVNLVHELMLGADPDDSDDEVSLEEKPKPVNFPSIYLDKLWHKKIQPGLSSFNQSPQKVGNRHLRYLLSYASAIVPKSEHYRTPIFLHATAGMRLLPPKEQQPILENVCEYLQTNSDFYVPHCKSHVNIIDGAIEGLYGWLSINYLIGAFDWPEEHAHGKEHNTYGLLDMGGASTQVVFQPNSTESKEHENNLYKLSLGKLPLLSKTEKDKNQEGQKIGAFQPPEIKEFDVFSDSFLGFGMFQAQSRYRSILVENYKKANEIPELTNYFRTPLPDPCLPKGYTTKELVNHNYVDFTGDSNFEECLTSIFPVIDSSTHHTGKSPSCLKLGLTDKVSSCLLDELIPAFDFDVNHFIGVSGYWDAINALSSYGNFERDKSEKYDYLKMYKATSQWCSRSFKEMIERNNLRDKDERIKEEELAQLCFKSSWILNFLHVGLGFPRIGIDEGPQKDDKFKSLQLVEKMGGLSFSWTLGRALLYSNDEYVQAFNNYTIEKTGNSENLLKRPGYYYTAREDAYRFGAESLESFPRPLYSPEKPGTKYTVFDYEYDYASHPYELKWYLKTHRFYGGLIFVLMVLVIIVLMLGRKGRHNIVSAGKMAVNKVLLLVGLRKFAYTIVPDYEVSDSYELRDANDDFRHEGTSAFTVEDEEEV
ncbi:hypothetical protein C7M61_004144 [Candidozyma pseudohaemuli]|uniref:Golgi apyrase n=1 Tax=Candidozyma pseudohaemuli TaxID=418784 RepID=A0A2P7YK51_9ASCO|nr:hypothetical protein C7M61_004144 [[Candida] pseudohaemulonii]PSK36320.1 hypothetical protein C7M61_004144 [[Candida] pseudohaemulonii]